MHLKPHISLELTTKLAVITQLIKKLVTPSTGTTFNSTTKDRPTLTALIRTFSLKVVNPLWILLTKKFSATIASLSANLFLESQLQQETQLTQDTWHPLTLQLSATKDILKVVLQFQDFSFGNSPQINLVRSTIPSLHSTFTQEIHSDFIKTMQHIDNKSYFYFLLWLSRVLFVNNWETIYYYK